MIEKSDDIVTVVNDAGIVAYAGPSWTKMLGYRPDEIEGRNAFDFMHPDALSAAHAVLGRVLADPTLNERIELQFRHKDGSWRWLDNVVRNLISDPAIQGVVVNTRDVTEQKKIAAALERRIQFDRLITKLATEFINLPAGGIDAAIRDGLKSIGAFCGADRSYIFAFHDDGKLITNTHEWCAAGVSPQIQNLAGVPMDGFPYFAERIRRREVVHVPDIHSLKTIAPDEYAVLVPQEIKSLIIVPMVSRGALMGFVGFDAVRQPMTFVQEIEELLQRAAIILANAIERKRSDDELHRRDTELRLAVQAAQLGSWRWDVQTDAVTIHQPGGAATFNGTMTDSVARMNSEDQKAIREAQRRTLENDEPYSVEFRATGLDGAEHTFVSRGHVYRDAQGKPLVMTGIYIDISERRQLEDQFRHAQKMEAIGQLAGGLAHDLNNLLSAILSSCELALLRLPPNEENRIELEHIQQAVSRAASLVQKLLAFSRKQVLQPRVLSLNHLLKDMESLLRRLVGNDVKLAVDLSTSPGNIKADPGQIEQVMMNLAVNARDAMPRGGSLAVTTRDVALDEASARQLGVPRPGSYVALTVSDTGTGMDAATCARIFEPFFTTKVDGTGLGLSTAYGIVKQSGGHIAVQSEPGKGATFIIHLPAVDGSSEASARPPVPAGGGTETVLLADDDSDVRTPLRDILRFNGYTVLEAQSAEQALQISGSHKAKIDLLITDVILPAMDGRHLALEIRKSRKELAVLYISGYSSNTVGKDGPMELDAPLLQKPFTSNTLLSRIRQVLKKL